MLKKRRKKITDLGYFKGTQCESCIKKCPNEEKGYYCFALEDFYFTQGILICYAYSDNPVLWLRDLEELRGRSKSKREYLEYDNEYNRIQGIINLMKQGASGKYEGLGSVYHEEVHRPLLKAPHGEKGDKVHKKKKQDPILYHFYPG